MQVSEFYLKVANFADEGWELFEDIYLEGGQSKVMDAGVRLDLKFEKCEPCDTETPTWDFACAVCGQTRPVF